jgi:NTP pyrophosphatase (non-canonical NTP hydrolase)
MLPHSEAEKENLIEAIALCCHEMNRRWCQLTGDASQPSWEDAPEWQRKSLINGVRFRLENPNAPDSASHDNWAAEKRADGWVWGPFKIPETKRHPCLVPFEELSPIQQAKDRLCGEVVRAFAESWNLAPKREAEYNCRPYKPQRVPSGPALYNRSDEALLSQLEEPGAELQALSEIVWNIAKNRGFRSVPGDVPLAVQLANIHGEVSELWEAYRKGTMNAPCDKPIPLTCAEEELADIIIRVLDTAHDLQIDLDHVVRVKSRYNISRPHKHGKTC